MSVRPEWNDYANWLLLTPAERKNLGLPASETAYANAKGISDRQLRRWKQDPIFQGLLEKLKTKQAEKISVSNMSNNSIDTDEEVLASSEDEYQIIKSTLIKGAMSGDSKYLDLYFRTYGKDFVAEEAAARSSDLASMDFDTLVLETMASLDIGSVIQYLQSNGYIVIQESEYNATKNILPSTSVDESYYYTGVADEPAAGEYNA
jgi:hypothetical protein